MEERKITIPGGWDDVTITQFQEMDYTNVTSLVSTLWDLDKETVERLDMDIHELIDHLSFLTEEPHPRFLTKLYDCKIVDIDTLTVGDLETIEKLCKEFKKNAHLIAAWMYRNDMPFETRAEMLRSMMKVDELFGAAVYAGLTAGTLAMPEVMASTLRKIEDMNNNPEGVKEAMFGANFVELDKATDKLKNTLHGS